MQDLKSLLLAAAETVDKLHKQVETLQSSAKATILYLRAVEEDFPELKPCTQNAIFLLTVKD